MNALSQFKNYVAEQYKSMLDVNLAEDTTASAPLVWLNDGNSAWLLDDEIGLAMRIVPFTDEQDDLNAALQHAIRTASQLQPRYAANATDTDKHGIWQVGICWLVDSGLSESWRKAIAGIRRESGFSEEIGLDAVLAKEGESINDACKRQGLPQLMLHARRTFQIKWGAMPNWLSANSKVTEMLKTFPNQFSGDSETYKLALELVEDVLPDEASDSALSDAEPKKEPLKEIEIKNFRNIKQCKFSFWNPEKLAQAHVVFGPNGTGKTSIFEALYLAAGGTSNTLAEYLKDEDVNARKRDYAATILTPLSSDVSSKPELILNGSEKFGYQAITKEDARTGTFEMEGTFQAQEDTRKFLEEEGSSLAQRILKNYSTLADEVIKHAEARAFAAKSEKSEWLKTHGLNAAISVRETRTKRLIEGEIHKEPWLPSQSLMDWLGKTSQFFPDILNDAERISLRWKNWRENEDDCISRMAQGVSIGEISIVRQPLATWLSTRNKLLEDTRILVSRATSSIEPLRNRLQGVESELDGWGEWLSRQTTQLSASTDTEQQQIVQQIEQIRQRLTELRQLFSIERKHSQHLERLEKEFLPDWAKTKPDICPTCGDNHHDRGGIEKVVESLKAGVNERLAQLEVDGKNLGAMLAEMEAKLASFGVCPVSEKRQAELRDLLGPFCKDASLQSMLTDRVTRTGLKNSIQAAQRLPEVQEPIAEPDDTATQLAERSLTLDAQAERLWALPERWAKIVKTLDGECRKIVEKHLPETLQKLWWEVALTLTPARWNLAATAQFQMNERKAQKLTIGIDERADTPARYFFNQAERHIMGLAWFFTRYLTHGRFHREFMVLDDPAQEMDQTTFRSFARFAQALLRLHSKQNVPAQLVFFLHQEERALDMARATLGRFIILAWQQENNGINDMREIRLVTDGFNPQTAIHVIKPQAATALQE
jgi:hypothetical protein